VVVYGTPGAVVLYDFISTSYTAPARALHGEQSDLYMVQSNNFLAMQPGVGGFGIVNAGQITTTSGFCSITASPTNAVVVDGTGGWVFTDGSFAFAAISPWQATGANTVTYVAGFFVAEQPKTQKFWVSNFNDPTTWNALAFAQLASDSGNIVAVDNLLGNLILFAEQGTESWQNVGGSPEPFAPILSASNEFGLAAIASRQHLDQTLVYLAQTRTGKVQVVQLIGLSPKVISDTDLENIINGFNKVDIFTNISAGISDAVALTYQIDTHKFYQITFPSALPLPRSFLWNASTGIWTEVQSGTQGGRHIGNLSTYWRSVSIISDYQKNILYTMSDTAYTDNGLPIVREVITRHTLSNFNRFRVDSLYLDMDTGVGTQTGQGVNPQVMLQYSKDNGRTWSAERWSSLGQVGQYLNRVLWRRFGSTRDATFRIRMTDPVKFVITEGALKLSERAQ